MEELHKLPSGAFVKWKTSSRSGPLPGVLIVHGWATEPFHEGGTYDRIAQALCEEGYHCLLLRLRGGQGSLEDQLKVTPEQNYTDVIEAFEYLENSPLVDGSGTCGFGVSYGGYLLAKAAYVVGLHLLALRSAALYPEEGWADPTIWAINNPELTQWRSQVHDRGDNEALHSLSLFEGDLLTISCELDEQMPPQVAESYRLAGMVSTRSSRAWVLKDAQHVVRGLQREELIATVAEWFKEYYPRS